MRKTVQNLKLFFYRLGLTIFVAFLLMGSSSTTAHAQASATATDGRCVTIKVFLINSAANTPANITRIKISDAGKYALQVDIKTNFGCTVNGKYTLKGQTYENQNGTNTTPQETFYFANRQPVTTNDFAKRTDAFGRPAHPYSYVYTLDYDSDDLSTNLSAHITITFTDDKGNSGSTPGSGGGSGSGSGTGSNSNVPPNNSVPNEDIKTDTDFTLVNLDDPIGTFDNLLNFGSVPEAIVSLIRILFILIGISAVIVIIIAGFRMVVDSGNETQMKKAKEAITWSIVGLIVSILAFSIVAIIQRIIQG